MKSDKEIVGTLLGFDDFVSILYYISYAFKSNLFQNDACLWKVLFFTFTMNFQDMVLEDVTEL